MIPRRGSERPLLSVIDIRSAHPFLERRGDVFGLFFTLCVLSNLVFLHPGRFIAIYKLIQLTHKPPPLPARSSRARHYRAQYLLRLPSYPSHPPHPTSPKLPATMAPLAAPDQNNISPLVRQSPPVDVSAPYSPTTLRGKTILLTGGASGLGAAFARCWASHGANLIIGDVNDQAGTSLVADLRASSRSEHHHFVQCDVASWPSQASLFQQAVTLSPTGELDAVVSAAGISDKNGAITGAGFENPSGLDSPNPPAPDVQTIEVNLLGTMYTAHLALFWLQQNSAAPPASDVRDARDRHLLLIGSYAGLSFLPGVPQYVTSKHGVTGLFRALRTLSYRRDIRVNMLCPYFVDTPILPSRAVANLAGLGMGRLEDAVDAATRFVSCAGAGASNNPRIAGRALVVGPRARLLRSVFPDEELRREGEGVGEPNEGGRDVIADEDTLAGRGQGVWEVYGHDFETVDLFVRRYVRLLNTIAAIKGWIGFWRELWHALFVRKEPTPARLRA